MYKLIIALIVLSAFGFADPPPPPWAKEGAVKDTTRAPLPPPFAKAAAQKKDTVFLVVSGGDTTIKEYSIVSSDPEYTVTRKTGEVVTHGLPPMKVLCTGENIKFTLSPKLVGGLVLFRNQDDSLIWKSKVPKSQQIEINTSYWKLGKYYSGFSFYEFVIIKE